MELGLLLTNNTMANLTFRLDNDLFSLKNIAFPEDFLLKNFSSNPARSIPVYLMPFIILVGVIGNIFALVVHTRTHLRREAYNMFLALLSFSDTMVLGCLLVVWLSHLQVNIFHLNVVCQTVVYLMNAFYFVSAWCHASIAILCLVLTLFPWHNHRQCAKKCTVLSSIIIICIALSLHSYFLWMTGIVLFDIKPVCLPLPQFHDTLQVLKLIDVTLLYFLPSLLIIFINAAVVFQMREFLPQKIMGKTTVQAGQKRKTALLRTSPNGSIHISFTLDYKLQTREGRTPPIKAILRGRYYFRIARMLVVTSTMYVLLSLPYFALLTYNVIRDVTGQDQLMRRHAIMQEVFELVYHMRFAINFILFSLLDRSFQTGVKRLFGRCEMPKKQCYKTDKVSWSSEETPVENESVYFKVNR